MRSPVFCSTVATVSCGPPIPNAALILPLAAGTVRRVAGSRWAGMST